MDRDLLHLGKLYIKNDDSAQLNEAINNLKTTDYQVNYEYIFTQLLYYSCINRKRWAITYFVGVYNEQMDPTARVGLRHAFIYAKYLCKDKDDKRWFETLKIS